LKDGSLRVGEWEMDAPQLISTMDATLAMLVTWISLAQQLDQTLLTNICLHRPILIKKTNQTLYAFSTAILHLMQTFRGCVQLAAVFNEEDFCPNSTIDTQAVMAEEENSVEELLEKAQEKVG